jgi:hypothetical protein
MTKEKQAKWDDLAQKHEFLFGKKPRKNMKLETLEKKVNDEAKNRKPSEDEVKQDTDSVEITQKMEELAELTKAESEKNEARTAMITLVATQKGVHMSMLGEGQDVAIMIATAMANQPMIDAVITNAAMMSQMRKQQVAQQVQDASGGAKAPEGMPKPQTEA